MWHFCDVGVTQIIIQTLFYLDLNFLCLNLTQFCLTFFLALSDFHVEWNTHSLSLSHNYTHSLSFSHTYTLTLSFSLSHTYTLTLSFSLLNTHTHYLSLSHTHTHTREEICIESCKDQNKDCLFSSKRIWNRQSLWLKFLHFATFSVFVFFAFKNKTVYPLKQVTF